MLQGETAPMISVIMRVYDGARFLPQAIDSVLSQTASQFELIVVDDGSTDATPEIAAQYARRDPRVIVHRQHNQGAAAAANVGVRLARAPLVAILDADDVTSPDRLERQRAFLGEHGSCGVVGGAVAYLDSDGRQFAEVRYPLSDAEIRDALDSTMPMVHSAAMFRKEMIERVGGYRTQFAPAEDLDLLLRVSEHCSLANLGDVVVGYRIHPTQLSTQHIQLQSLCAVAARVAAQARHEGHLDPFDGVGRMDEQAVLSAGATDAEIVIEFVHSATWLAKTMDRAGYRLGAEKLFAQAQAMARSGAGSGALAAHVHRERAARQIEEGRRIRAGVETLRAAIAERAR